MADHDNRDEEMSCGGVQAHDLTKILSSPERDYLIRNNGEQVKIDSLKGKNVGLYFSASWCGPCGRFTPFLVEVYNELISKGDFEVIFVSADEDEDSFQGYFSHMPWLAIPFSDSEVRDSLNAVFNVDGIPFLVLLDQSGAVVTDDGVESIAEYGADAYPFTAEAVVALKEEDEEAKRNQSLISLLVNSSSDFVVSSDGKKVPVSSLQGKTVGIYFPDTSHGESVRYTKDLVTVYKEILKGNEPAFEVVMVPLDDEEESFKDNVESVPWLSLPFKDKRIRKLLRYFEPCSLPSLAIIAPDGKTLHSDVAEIVGEHGSIAYPFTPERLDQLEELEQAKRDAQTLESVLVSDEW